MARDFDDRRAVSGEMIVQAPTLPSARGSQLPRRPRPSAPSRGNLARCATGLFFAFVLVAVGLMLRRSVWVALSLPFILYSGVWALAQLSMHAPDLRIRRDLEHVRVTEGEQVRVLLTVENAGPRIPLAAIEDLLPEGMSVTEGSPQHLGDLPARDSVRLTYTVQGSRGRFDFPGVRAITWSRFATASHEAILECTDTLHAAPQREPVGRIAIRPRRTRAFAGPVKANLGGPGVDYFGCRAYTLGDPVRRINWRAYARRDDLIVNDYEQERIADVSIIVDARAQAHAIVGEQTTFEYTLRAAASVSETFLAQGNSVGLLLYGDYVNWVFPDVGKVQQQRILDALSRAQVGDKVAYEDLRFIPTKLFPPQSQLVLISSLPIAKDVEILSMLRARGYAILLICPSPLAESARLGDAATRLAARMIRLRRTHFLDSLAGLGVRVIDWDVTEPLGAVLESLRFARIRRGS